MIESLFFNTSSPVLSMIYLDQTVVGLEFSFAFIPSFITTIQLLTFAPWKVIDNCARATQWRSLF